MSKAKYFLRIRSYRDTPWVTVWVIRVDGPAESSVLWGDLFPAIAEELAVTIALPVEREERPYRVTSPQTPPEGVRVVPATLFDLPAGD